MTSQLGHPAAWRKAHRRRLALVGLGPTEQHLLLVLDMLGARDPARLVNRLPAPDVGWATREDGRALTRRELAAHLRLAPGAAGLAELEAAIAGLVELGHAVVADDGAVGVTGWADLQETPRRRRRHRGAPQPVVYFLQDGPTGPVKIGFTRHLQARIEELQCGHKDRLRLLGSRPGGRREEREIHRRLAAHRLRGEWFAPAPAVLAAAKETP